MLIHIIFLNSRKGSKNASSYVAPPPSLRSHQYPNLHTNQRLIYCLLFCVYLRIFYSCNDVTVAGWAISTQAFDRLLWSLSREGSLSCHTYYGTGPRFKRSHPKDGQVQSPLITGHRHCRPSLTRFPMGNNMKLSMQDHYYMQFNL